jgi:hypothetical protein
VLVASTVNAGTVRRALVIAYNGSDKAGTSALRFADDDGYRWRETLERLGIDVTLLTTPDTDTARVELWRRTALKPPTTRAVAEAVSGIASRNRADRAAGSAVDTIVVYVGHGQTDDAGRAYLTLADGRLDQSSLYESVVDRLSADYVHLIVDACHAGGVVGSRGADPVLLDELRARLGREQLKSRPHVGALFAESEEGETHEWSRIRAGIFSHAARSALLGGGDVNHDGVVGYSELEAFVASAIRGVKAGAGRLKLRTSAPSLDPSRAIAGPAPAGPMLQVPGDMAFSRLSIEDTDGVRLVDLNRHPGERVVLALPAREAYWLRTATGEARVTAAELGGAIALVSAEFSSRGGVEEGYSRGFFAVPFGRGFFEGYHASQDGVPLSFPDVREAVNNDAPGRFDGAWLGLGLSVGLPATLAPLGAPGLAGGIDLTWRSNDKVYWGVRGQWVVALATLDRATVHRGAVGPLLGIRGSTSLSPFVEVAAQWVPHLVFRSTVTQGDLTAFGGRLAAGVMGSRELLRGWRLLVSLDTDAVLIDGSRRAAFVPGVELSISL